MTTNESSGLTKYKLNLMDTGQADMGNQEGDRVIGEPTGEAWQRGQAVVKGKWGRLGHGGNWLGKKEAKWGGRKERPHKTKDFEKCASMPKTSLLSMKETDILYNELNLTFRRQLAVTIETSTTVGTISYSYCTIEIWPAKCETLTTIWKRKQLHNSNLLWRN